MKSIDVFAHVLPPKFFQKMLAIALQIPDQAPFIKNRYLTEPNLRNEFLPDDSYQIISAVNVLPEDFVGPDQAAQLCREGNEEIVDIVKDNDRFLKGIAMLPMNNMDAAVEIIQGIPASDTLVGAQIFTRALGKSIADPEFQPVFKAAAENNVPLLLHPVFDARKPDNNIVFSWEYELSNAMLQLVQAKIFDLYPTLKIIVHHAGAMAPFFAGRIDRILPAEQAAAFRRFYVDTAILGNPPALRLAIDYYGSDHVLFGTDAPFGIAPAGATSEILKSLEDLHLPADQQEEIYFKNYQRLFE